MTETLKMPKEVVDSDWRDDIGDYETYGTNKQEMEYVSPGQVSHESIKKIKARNAKIGRNVLNIFKQDNLAA
ncbi:hypothetical protein IKF21_01770 [Candidatus Saccharibacteria bacterium]|nr:hypothetical protein [Candidatus Saccharibacteria bacterium]